MVLRGGLDEDQVGADNGNSALVEGVKACPPPMGFAPDVSCLANNCGKGHRPRCSRRQEFEVPQERGCHFPGDRGVRTSVSVLQQRVVPIQLPQSKCPRPCLPFYRRPPRPHEPLRQLKPSLTPYTLHINAGAGTRWSAGTLSPGTLGRRVHKTRGRCDARTLARWDIRGTLTASVWLSLSSPFDAPVSSLGDPPRRHFYKVELMELKLVMVSRVAKWVPPSCSLFVAYRLYRVSSGHSTSLQLLPFKSLLDAYSLRFEVISSIKILSVCSPVIMLVV